MIRLKFHRFFWMLALTPLITSAAWAAPPVDAVLQHVPDGIVGLSEEDVALLSVAADELEDWVATGQTTGSPQAIFETARQRMSAKRQVDEALNDLLKLRSKFAELTPSDQRTEDLKLYLRCVSEMIDLTGRLRYSLRDQIHAAAFRLKEYPQQYRQLIEQVKLNRLGIGASVMAFVLFDPPPDQGLIPFTIEEKYAVLETMAISREADLLPIVAAYVREETNPGMVVIGAELIRQLGLPQTPRPGQDSELPQAPVTASQLREILTGVNANRLAEHLRKVHRSLLDWLDQRIRTGVQEDSYRIGTVEVRAGDWLLMRNPSPYNRFTDLSPGLFTHVGVVAVEEGSDGIRRFVIVDLPERGTEIPATNVDTYLMRTLHYVFLRHQDPQVSQAMGQVALDIIGNESLFDLNFDSSRVEALRGKPLKGQRIHTYCAGLLLLCAQRTEEPQASFFPIAESAAGGQMAENLGRLGLSIGDDFASPTGALFSPEMEIVGRREPMYDPGREIEEAVYDAFAAAMIESTLTPSPTVFQALREQVAAAASENPLLAQALARATDVNEDMDLVAAARTAAVVETLDQVAEENRESFLKALEVVRMQEVAPEQEPLEAAVSTLRQRHVDLIQRWQAGRLAPRQLRIELVRYYAQRGQEQIRQRFFQASTEDQ